MDVDDDLSPVVVVDVDVVAVVLLLPPAPSNAASTAALEVIM